MNELIKELAVQAELHLELQSLKVEKFAELLLQECVQILDRRNEHPVIVNSIKEIKETFGV